MVSPFQKLFHKQPEISSLKVFGSTIYPYLRPYNSHKLQARSIQCVFLGYSFGYKGVVYFNMLTGKLLVSKHVVHDEYCFPFATIKSNARYFATEFVHTYGTSTRPSS